MYSKNDYRYYLEHRASQSEDFLMHYGVKGMKWHKHLKKKFEDVTGVTDTREYNAAKMEERALNDRYWKARAYEREHGPTNAKNMHDVAWKATEATFRREDAELKRKGMSKLRRDFADNYIEREKEKRRKKTRKRKKTKNGSKNLLKNLTTREKTSGTSLGDGVYVTHR